MIVYVDTSFLVAAYVVDEHSPTVAKMMAGRPSICLTPFSLSEAVNAIYRQAFIGRLTLVETARAWKTFESDCTRRIWQTVPFPNSAWDISMNLAQRFCPTLGVRTLDSLHVACALELKADRFWTLDDRQVRLAEAVGLDTGA